MVKSVILEKERDVTSDPRGVYLTGDAVRMLYDLGIGHKMEEISHGKLSCVLIIRNDGLD